MKKHFVWTRGIEQKFYETLSDKSKRLASNSDVIVKQFSRALETSNHYRSSAVTTYALSRDWKNVNKSSIFRALERNQRLWEGIGLVFSAFELQKALTAPHGSIIVATFGVGGYSFEIIKPTDPNYLEACASLPGVA